MRSSLTAQFIAAPDSQTLQKDILKYQVMRGGQIKIITIYEQKDGTVICWFYDDETAFRQLKQKKK